MGFKAATACARKAAYEADRQGYVQRGRTERKHRRVGIRPAPDTMSIFSGYLPVEQGVACYAALRQHADAAVATGDERARDQIMADTLVERITGQTRAADLNVELHIMMPLDALTDPESPAPPPFPDTDPCPAKLPNTSWPTARDANGGADSSPPHPANQAALAPSWAATPTAASSTAGSPN